MKAIIINLDSATQRLDFQTKQLNRFGIEFQRLPATFINGSNDLIYKKYKNKWERVLRPAEVAAFFSHKEAWEIVEKSSKPMLILEDDACLASNINCVLEAIKDIENIDYINIEITGKNKKKLLAKKAISELCNSQLYRLYQGRSGAGGYVLWPSGAHKLLKQSANENIGLADKFINANYSLIAYQLDPAVLIQLDQCEYHGIKAPLKMESSITPKAVLEVKLDRCTICRIRRVVTQIKTGLNHLLHIHHAQKRKVGLSKLLFNIAKENKSKSVNIKDDHQ